YKLDHAKEIGAGAGWSDAVDGAEVPGTIPGADRAIPDGDSPDGVDTTTTGSIGGARNSLVQNAAYRPQAESSAMALFNPERYFPSIRSAESGGNDQARNQNSSATGRDQFLEGTWNGLMKKYPELGLTREGRTDPRQQERAIQAFTKENANQLQAAGIPVTNGTLYAAHFLGAGGARQVLGRGTANDRVADLVPREVLQA